MVNEQNRLLKFPIRFDCISSQDRDFSSDRLKTRERSQISYLLLWLHWQIFLVMCEVMLSCLSRLQISTVMKFWDYPHKQTIAAKIKLENLTHLYAKNLRCFADRQGLQMRRKITIIVSEAVMHWLGSKILMECTETDIVLEDYYKERREAGLNKKKKQTSSNSYWLFPTDVIHCLEILPITLTIEAHAFLFSSSFTFSFPIVFIKLYSISHF